MRISAKGRYAIASMIYMGQQKNKLESNISLVNISKSLGISKIYLEQVFSALKKKQLVVSIKGPQGGYQLSRNANSISVYDILMAVELTLFDQNEKLNLSNNYNQIDTVMHNILFDPLDKSIKKQLESISLALLIEEADSLANNDEWMYYI